MRQSDVATQRVSAHFANAHEFWIFCFYSSCQSFLIYFFENGERRGGKFLLAFATENLRVDPCWSYMVLMPCLLAIFSFPSGEEIPYLSPLESFTLKSIFQKTLIEAHTRALCACLVVWYAKPANKAHTVKFGGVKRHLKIN